MENLVQKHRVLIESKNYPTINPSQLHYMAQLIENQDKEFKLLKESGTVTADVAQYLPILTPLIRRTYPNLIANTIAGVQAMNAPTGAIFALTGRLLGKGSDENVVTPTNAGQILVAKADTGFTQDVGDELTGSVTSATGKIVFKSKDSKKVLVKLGDVTKKFTTEDKVNTSEEISEVYSNEAAFLKILPEYTGPVTTATGETEGNDMKEIGLAVEKVEARADTRNLKGRFTLELLQDLKALYGSDAEKEIMNIMSQEVQREMDTEIKNAVVNSAYQLPDFTLAGTDLGRWAIEKLRALTLKIANESREISRTSRRGAGNVLIVSPKIATCLEAVGNFVLSPASGSINAQNSGVNPVLGKFDNKYTVAVDDQAEKEYFTVLYKGSDKDAGVYLAVYTGITFVKVTDPATGNPALILKSRYCIVNNPLGADNFARTAVVNLSNVL